MILIGIQTHSGIIKAGVIKEQKVMIVALHEQSEDRRKLYPKIVILERLITPKVVKQLDALIKEYTEWEKNHKPTLK